MLNPLPPSMMSFSGFAEDPVVAIIALQEIVHGPVA
jgi:hypothetical protein